MKISASSIFFCLPPLIIAAVVCVVTPSFAVQQVQGDDGPMLLQLGQLHGRLKLTDSQEALWRRALDASNKPKMRQAERKQAVAEMREALDNPHADLRALSGKMDARREIAEKESTDVRELWLALNDSLDVNQREVVRKFLIGRMERIHGRHDA